MDAMIVAGGRGTRLRPLTSSTPKPLLAFCGAPFLTGVIRRLAAAGVDRVFLVVGADTEPFAVLRDDAEAHGVTVVMVPEPEPLDTAGGVRAAVEQVDGAFLVLNGDILTDVPFDAVVAAHRSADADATIVLTRVEDTSSFGVCVREGSRIVDFVEKPAPGTLPGQDAVNAGTYVLQPDTLLAFPPGPLSFEREVFPGVLAGGGTIEGMVWDGVWADLGTPGRWRAGHRLALDGAVSWPTVEAVPDRGDGVRVHPDAAVDTGAELVGPVLVLEHARIAAGARVGPHVVLGAGATVGADAVLADCVIGAASAIGAGITAAGLITGERATIEPEVALGDGVVLGEGERVPTGERLGDGERRPG